MAATADDLKGLPRMELEPEKKPQAQRLVELVPDEALFRSTDGESAFATLPAGDHLETMADPVEGNAPVARRPLLFDG